MGRRANPWACGRKRSHADPGGRWEFNCRHVHVFIIGFGVWRDLLGLSEALRKAEDREEWRKVVALSSLMPNGHLDYGMSE